MEENKLISYENYFNDEENYYVSKIYDQIDKELEKMQKGLYTLKDIALVPKGKYLKKKKNILEPAKKGRKKKDIETKIEPIHSKFCFDNLLRKIKVMYHCFIINFINDYIKLLYGIQRFRIRKVCGKITQNVTKQHNFLISTKPLKDFLSNQISKKYKIENEDKNKKNIEKFYNMKTEAKTILDMSYINFYKNFFLCDNIKYLEKNYGICNKTYTLSDQMKILRKKESDIYCREFELTARQKFLLFLGVNDNYFNINNIYNKNNIFKCTNGDIFIEIKNDPLSEDTLEKSPKKEKKIFPFFSVIKDKNI